MVEIHIEQLHAYLEEILQPGRWQDYCPNGLQVLGDRPITKLVTGVTACQALLDAAIAHQADAILVHHGYFWKGEMPCIVGIKRKRLATLLQHDLHLLAYHLPLDAHVEWGNNRQLAKQLDIVVTGEFGAISGVPGLGLIGKPHDAMSGKAWCLHVEQRLQRQPLYIPGHSVLIERVAWCTGAAQDFIDQAVAWGVDAYLTGEVSERTVHIAREAGIHFYAAGHHATERYGVKALGEHLAQHFSIAHQFIDIDNPV